MIRVTHTVTSRLLSNNTAPDARDKAMGVLLLDTTLDIRLTTSQNFDSQQRNEPTETFCLGKKRANVPHNLPMDNC